jgi:hypothetical protein
MSRPSRIVLGLLCVYAATVLTLAAARTIYIQQDAAHYCEVAQRFADGEGLTSLSDRRGPAEPRAFPQPYAGNSAWPLILGLLTLATGDAETTGTVVNILALLGSMVLGTLCLTRFLGVPGLPAVLCTAAAVLHRDSVQSAILPLTDSLSLFLNIATATALFARRLGLSLALVALAIAVRYQNAVLVLPLLWVWIPDRPWAPHFRAGLIASAVALAMAWGGSALWEGLGVFLDPSHRDSLWRGIRFLSVPVLIGLLAWRSQGRLGVLWVLGLGHLLLLLCYPDPSDNRPWLFAQRHGLPFHFVAAAVAGVSLTRLRGSVYWLCLVAVAVAFGENLARPLKVLQAREETTARPDLAMAEDHLRRHPLGEDAIVLSQDADFLAYELGLRSVHLRGFDPDPAEAFREHLATRSITHVLLAWVDKPVSRHRVERLEAFARCLRPHSEVVAEGEDIGHRSLFMLLRLEPR